MPATSTARTLTPCAHRARAGLRLAISEHRFFRSQADDRNFWRQIRSSKLLFAICGHSISPLHIGLSDTNRILHNLSLCQNYLALGGADVEPEILKN